MSAEAIILLATGLVAVIGALIAATATIVIYFNDSLSKNTTLLYAAIEKVTTTIITKLEYHEQHDDIRFAQIIDRNNATFKEQSDRIWNIELRNAAKDGVLPHEYKKN